LFPKRVFLENVSRVRFAYDITTTNWDKGNKSSSKVSCVSGVRDSGISGGGSSSHPHSLRRAKYFSHQNKSFPARQALRPDGRKA
jgi:hypothetical protein